LQKNVIKNKRSFSAEEEFPEREWLLLRRTVNRRAPPPLGEIQGKGGQRGQGQLGEGRGPRVPDPVAP